jgi:Fe-Mn family superoxide dismutase
MQCFGSGWLWLVAGIDGGLMIETSGNADTPAVRGARCLLTLDLWEHACYLDYQNRRREYLQAICGRFLNWEFADSNL